jgi:lysophospholipase L1-like esterase
MPGIGRWLARSFLVIASGIFAANLLGAAALHLKNTISSKPSTVTDRRSSLPNYQGVAWASTHFREFAVLPMVYHSYDGWRRLPYRGQTINIDENGIRRTYAHPSAEPVRTIAFFGGSTTWGSGADDEHTIPSLFAKLRPEYRAINFGETAHTAHQNLNTLIKVLADGLIPDVVVFYNGSSEIHKCRVGLTSFSEVDEPRIRRFLAEDDRGLLGGEAAWSLLYPARQFAEVALRSVQARIYGASEKRDCGDDAVKTERIARTMLWDWLAAKRLVEGYGGRFVAALQPVAYFSQTRTDHITIDPDLTKQYGALYPRYAPMLGREFPALEANFLDLHTAFDRDEYIYIDADHASPNGNAIIAARISDYLTN